MVNSSAYRIDSAIIRTFWFLNKLLSVSQYLIQYGPLSSLSSSVSKQLVSPGSFPWGFSQNYCPSVSAVAPTPHTAKDITDHTHPRSKDLSSSLWESSMTTLWWNLFSLHGLCSLFLPSSLSHFISHEFFIDPIPNSCNQHQKDCIADGKEHYYWDLVKNLNLD